MAKVEGRGPDESLLPLCPRVTLFGLFLVGLLPVAGYLLCCICSNKMTDVIRYSHLKRNIFFSVSTFFIFLTNDCARISYLYINIFINFLPG